MNEELSLLSLVLNASLTVQLVMASLVLASVISSAISGICNDKRTDCANWARDGECSGENAVRPNLAAAVLKMSS